jgi:hypothetical protein
MIKFLKFLGMPFIILFGNAKAPNSTSSKNTTNTTTTAASPKKVNWTTFSKLLNILVILVIIYVVIRLVVFSYSSICEIFSKNGNNQTQTTTEKQKTVYYFKDFPNGKITVYLKSDAEWYPKGGKIKYKTSSGKIFSDEPGTSHTNNPEPDGDFTFWADESSAWGVEIWQ